MIRTFNDTHPNIDASAYIDQTAVIIGDVSIASEASIWPMVVIRGDIHSIRIGERSNIQDGSIIHVTHAGPFNETGFGTIIGADVIIGHKAMLHGCTIQDSCLIGMSATIMDGAIIESHCLIAAGSVVTPGTVCESGYLYAGTPAKKIRPLKQKELDFLPYSAAYYVKLGQQHKEQTSCD